MPFTLSFLLAWAAVAVANPFVPRAVTSLNEEATAEAQRRDDSATRAFSNVQIKTSDGRCLFVDKLSGDFRANLTPIQVAACGSTQGQGWDIITKGTHISGSNVMLIVSTLTQACFNFDPRRAAGNQVLLFSCGGRADGGGAVTDSQLFSFDGSAGPLSIKPQNQAGSCFAVKGNVVDIATCKNGDASQQFTFGGASTGSSGAGAGNNGGNTASDKATATRGAAANDATTSSAVVKDAVTSSSTTSCTRKTRTVRVSASETEAAAQTNGSGAESTGAETSKATKTRSRQTKSSKATSAAAETSVLEPDVGLGAALPDATDGSSSTTTSAAATGTTSASGFISKSKTKSRTKSGAVAATESAKAATTTATSAATTSATAAATNGILTANPTAPVPVSRAGGTLQPSAAAEANKRDATATRAFSDVSIRAPNGQCLFIDPTAGDFRQNLIPVSLVDCAGSPNEKWDIITAGVHNKPGSTPATLVVSTLTQGCISFDGRRQTGDTVTLFSCGGRADGSGETNNGQQFPYIGQLSFAFAPLSERNATCILPGNGRLESGPCPTDGSQLFSIFP